MCVVTTYSCCPFVAASASCIPISWAFSGLNRSPADEPVYQFMDRKRAEGKPYRVYMMASANKFLRIYYATVKRHLDILEA